MGCRPRRAGGMTQRVRLSHSGRRAQAAQPLGTGGVFCIGLENNGPIIVHHFRSTTNWRCPPPCSCCIVHPWQGSNQSGAGVHLQGSIAVLLLLDVCGAAGGTELEAEAEVPFCMTWCGCRCVVSVKSLLAAHTKLNQLLLFLLLLLLLLLVPSGTYW